MESELEKINIIQKSEPQAMKILIVLAKTYRAHNKERRQAYYNLKLEQIFGDIHSQKAAVELYEKFKAANFTIGICFVLAKNAAGRK